MKILFIVISALIVGCGSNSSSTTQQLADNSNNSEIPGEEFVPTPMPPIQGALNSEFTATPINHELSYGFLKTFSKGDPAFGEDVFDFDTKLLVMSNLPIGCEQGLESLEGNVRISFYFSSGAPPSITDVYAVRWVDKDPSSNAWSIKSSDGTSPDVSATLDDITSNIASGSFDIAKAGAEYSGPFSVVVCN